MQSLLKMPKRHHAYAPRIRPSVMHNTKTVWSSNIIQQWTYRWFVDTRLGYYYKKFKTLSAIYSLLQMKDMRTISSLAIPFGGSLKKKQPI